MMRMRIMAAAVLCVLASTLGTGGCAAGPGAPTSEIEMIRAEITDLAAAVKASADQAAKQAAANNDPKALAHAQRLSQIAGTVQLAMTDPAAALSSLALDKVDPLYAGLAEYAIAKVQRLIAAQNASTALVASPSG